MKDSEDEVLETLCIKRHLQTTHLIQDAAQRPHVTLMVIAPVWLKKHDYIIVWNFKNLYLNDYLKHCFAEKNNLIIITKSHTELIFWESGNSPVWDKWLIHYSYNKDTASSDKFLDLDRKVCLWSSQLDPCCPSGCELFQSLPLLSWTWMSGICSETSDLK